MSVISLVCVLVFTTTDVEIELSSDMSLCCSTEWRTYKINITQLHANLPYQLVIPLMCHNA